MSKIVKSCDYDWRVAGKVLEALNPGVVKFFEAWTVRESCIMTDADPRDLVYPEGWCASFGIFTNNYMHTTVGTPHEIKMIYGNGIPHGEHYITSLNQ